MCYRQLWLVLMAIFWFLHLSSPFATSAILDDSLLQSTGVVKERKVDDGKNITYPNYNLYHRSDVLLQEVQALVNRHPNIMSLEVLKSEASGYSAEIDVVTVEIGQKADPPDQRMHLLLDFGQHGRELITSEVALRLLKILAGEYPMKSADKNAVFHMLPHTTIKIIPMENVGGRRRVEAGHLCERKNGRGVDINRNWAVDWGKKEKDYDPFEEYPGTGPFSEPESLILKELAETFKPHLWVNVHSGMEAMFMPYDHKKQVPTDGAALPMEALLQTLNKMHCSKRCAIGAGGNLVGYLAHGTATDYMYDALKVPVAFTFEIYGDLQAPEEDCFLMFNPVTSAAFERVLSDWSTAFLTILVNLPATLRILPNKTPLQDWKSKILPAFSENDLYDTEFKKQYLMIMKERGFRHRHRKQGSQWDISRDEARWITNKGTDDEAALMLEFLCLISGVLLLGICFKVCKICWCLGKSFLS